MQVSSWVLALSCQSPAHLTMFLCGVVGAVRVVGSILGMWSDVRAISGLVGQGLTCGGRVTPVWSRTSVPVLSAAATVHLLVVIAPCTNPRSSALSCAHGVYGPDDLIATLHATGEVWLGVWG